MFHQKRGRFEKYGFIEIVAEVAKDLDYEDAALDSQEIVAERAPRSTSE